MTETITIVYTNYKGITSLRAILPERVYFGSNEWHPEPQWLLDAHDLDRNAPRTFAMKDISAWVPGKLFYGARA